ncbi:MAG: UDP-2,4-diacetamido-2,4,6-trideoxy-beta-L-altropyranose hydrolase [Lachnospiraceae bacterium]|nr:UDP-2,4-diacetamido-2,4,6-trideoxy-beta-L-altropyranose hydrolase [Lachnospiraceae bacterium]
MQYIRVDANERIGTGHVMRCLSIAKELRNRQEETVFLIADSDSSELISEHGFPFICLSSVWNDLEYEMDVLIQVIVEQNISRLLIDSYFVTKPYLEIIGRYTKIIYLDDLNRFIYPVDFLVNYNFYAENLDYSFRYREAGLETKFVLGSQYVPLRKEFSSVTRTINQKVSNILISTGGTDPYNVAGELLLALTRQVWFENYDYYVIIGKYNKNQDTLKLQWGDKRNVHLICNCTNLADYMKTCDIAITAGGVTTYELCACGIPSIMYTLADNQLDIAKTVSDRNLIPWTGDVRTDRDSCMEAILRYIELFSHNYSLREKICKDMQRAVDGNGVERLAAILLTV